MSYGIINPTAEQQQAWEQHPWGQIIQQNEQLRALLPEHDPRTQRLRDRVTFSDQAVAILGAMNTFDAGKVLEEILYLTRNPNPAGCRHHWRDGWRRFVKSRYPFRNYHYLIRYEVQGNGHIAISEIFFDDKLLGSQEPHSHERNMLYNVKRGNGTRYDRPMSLGEVVELQGAWELSSPVPSITTRHAAVNGMKNELGKGAWLMGVHLDAAYRNANPDEYTLFHNPTEGTFVDLVECLWDKPRINTCDHFSHNARHLAAVLHQRQKSGEMTEWVVHSQGAIIFNAAVIHHNTVTRTPLNRHRVAVHGSGAHVEQMRTHLKTARIELVHVRNNPFDAVPNVAGANNLRGSGLYRSLQFVLRVLSNNGGNSGISPHTLPYLGIRTYQSQLELGGYTRKAKQVQRYIAERDRQRQQRRAGGII